MLKIDKTQKFGVEIEFYGVPRQMIKAELYQQGLIDKGWKVKEELLIDFEIRNTHKGEVTSKILLNNKEDLIDLKKTLKILKEMRAQSDCMCGAHVHFDAQSIINENVRYLQDLLLLYICYEDVIFKFSAGEDENIRASAWRCAKPVINHYSYDEIEQYLYFDLDFLEFSYSFIEERPRNLSLNLQNIKYGGYNTVEFRSPNGTLDIEIWLNNINLFGSMIEYSKKMPSEVRKYLLSEIQRKKEIPFDAEFIYLKKAHDFIDLIKYDDEHKNNFIKQYQKKF